MKRINKGFTLIELLVVIAIIGILASIILVSLNSARKKGADTRVIADVQQVRDALETSYNGAYYPDLSTVAGASGHNNTGVTACTVANWLNTGPQNVALNTQINDACSQGGANDITINETGAAGAVNAYAIYGNLASVPGNYFCIDSTGRTNQSTQSLGATCQ